MLCELCATQQILRSVHLPFFRDVFLMFRHFVLIVSCDFPGCSGKLSWAAGAARQTERWVALCDFPGCSGKLLWVAGAARQPERWGALCKSRKENRGEAAQAGGEGRSARREAQRAARCCTGVRAGYAAGA